MHVKSGDGCSSSYRMLQVKFDFRLILIKPRLFRYYLCLLALENKGN